MDITYKTIITQWKQGNTTTISTQHGVTKGESLEQAVFFGYVEPKWWQFWKNNDKLKMTCF